MKQQGTKAAAFGRRSVVPDKEYLKRTRAHLQSILLFPLPAHVHLSF